MKLQIELTTKCQCKCTFCIRHIEPLPTAGKIIEDALFTKILNDAKEFNITLIYLTGLGETFLDPGLERKVKQVRSELGDKLHLGIYTNGMLATKDKVDALYKAGMNEIYFSLNAATPEMWTQIMGVKDGNQYKKVVQNINDALSIHGLTVHVTSVTSAQWIDPHEVEGLMSKYSPNVLHMVRGGNWAGKIYPLDYKPLGGCRWIDDHYIYVNIEGEVCLCCFDPYGQHSFGNVKKESLENIYWGEKRQEFINKIKQEGRKDVKPCKHCSTI